jgi:cystathionine gamma-synthase
MQQSETASILASWLSTDADCLKVVSKVHHASLPGHVGHEAAMRQGCGWSGVLSIAVHSSNKVQERRVCTEDMH